MEGTDQPAYFVPNQGYIVAEPPSGRLAIDERLSLSEARDHRSVIGQQHHDGFADGGQLHDTWRARRIAEEDLSRIHAVPVARLGCLAFEGQRAFAS